jgi:hypothetical protein
MEDKKSLDLIFDEARRQLKLQNRRIHSVDGKMATIGGFTGVILGIAITKQFLDTHCLGLLKTGIIFLTSSLIFSLCASFPKKYREDPNSKVLEEDYIEKDEATTKRQILSNYNESYVENEKILKNKVLLGKFSIITLIIGLLFIIINFFIGG